MKSIDNRDLDRGRSRGPVKVSDCEKYMDEFECDEWEQWKHVSQKLLMRPGELQVELNKKVRA